MQIYLDNNATTALDEKVFEACSSELCEVPSNPSSVHSFGRAARNRLIIAREQVAKAFFVKPTEVIFTSGGTESLNMVLKGLKNNAHIITSNVEHAAVFNTLKLFENVTYLDAGPYGAVKPKAVLEALRPNTCLITLMAANNETGVKTDLASIAAIAKSHKIPFVVDAVSWIGKEPFEMHEGISAICLSGHKFHAPKGIGALILRKELKIEPLITGGHQEFEKRGGTENLAGIIGLAKALSLCNEGSTTYMCHLRNHFEKEVLRSISDVTINGTGPRICNVSNLSFHGVEGEVLLMKLDLMGIYASHGSACSSGALEPSRILLNMGLGKETAASSLRFSLSRFTTLKEIDHTLSILQDLVPSIRGGF